MRLAQTSRARFVAAPRGNTTSVASYTVNKRAVAHARELIDRRQYVVRSEWGEAQPKAADQDAYLASHTWKEYGAWHLGLTEDPVTRRRGDTRSSTATFGAASLWADRVRLPSGGVGPQGDRARRAQAPPATRQDASEGSVANERVDRELTVSIDHRKLLGQVRTTHTPAHTLVVENARVCSDLLD